MLATYIFFGLLATSLANVIPTASRANEVFGYNVYKILAKTDGNVLVCPLSVSTILALTAMGAERNTFTEMTTTLALPQDKREIANSYSQLTGALKSEGKVTLDVANRIFPAKDIVIKDDFKHTAVQSFKSDAQNLDYSDSEKSAQTINSWVEKITHDKIKNLVDPSKLSAATRMVLVNAIYFNGKWKKSFALESYPLKFRLNEHDTVDVPRLYQEEDFRYYDDRELGAQILELPYDNEAYSLVLILPHEINGLAAVESKLPINFDEKLQMTKVRVTIPKFKIESSIEFIPILQQLGMKDPFTSAADFSDLSDEPLLISNVIQKAFIEVDEKGTVAAAATAVIMDIRITNVGKILRDTVVYADHPFLFLLHNKSTKTVLFVGRVTNF